MKRTMPSALFNSDIDFFSLLRWARRPIHRMCPIHRGTIAMSGFEPGPPSVNKNLITP
jgi:hypothetical protein